MNETALVDALQTRGIFGAGLDVFESEPLSPESPLTQLPRAVLTPHISAGTVDTFQ